MRSLHPTTRRHARLAHADDGDDHDNFYDDDDDDVDADGNLGDDFSDRKINNAGRLSKVRTVARELFIEGKLSSSEHQFTDGP